MATTSTAGGVVGSTGAWSYTLENGVNGAASPVQSLAQGESHDDKFTIQVDDGNGGVANQLISVSVRIALDTDVFSAFAGLAGHIGADSLAVDSAGTANTRILYSSSTGSLSYDPDGGAADNAKAFATLMTDGALDRFGVVINEGTLHPGTLTVADFLLA